MRTLRLRSGLRALVTMAALSAAVTSSAPTRRPATFDDVLNIKTIQGATVSPDGRQVIYGVREWGGDAEKMEPRSHIWKVPADGSAAARQISFGEKGDTSAQFSPDGKYISFL